MGGNWLEGACVICLNIYLPTPLNSLSMKKSINSFIAMIMVAISANAQMKVSNT
jgi:hypothetical protein